jgi:hypothetical protein
MSLWMLCIDCQRHFRLETGRGAELACRSCGSARVIAAGVQPTRGTRASGSARSLWPLGLIAGGTLLGAMSLGAQIGALTGESGWPFLLTVCGMALILSGKFFGGRR